MSDLLEQSAAWLDEQRHRHLTKSVTYRRGSTVVQVQATVGRTVFRVDSAYGASVRYVSRDYLIRTGDMVLNGEQTLPQRGDVIVETNSNGVEILHEVMGPGNGEPDWRYSDPRKLALRIHTKEIGSS